MSKHNWKTKAIRDHWRTPLEQFVHARREAALAALEDDSHPRQVLRRRLPADRVSELLSQVPSDVTVATETVERGTAVVLTSSDCPVMPEAVLTESEVDRFDLLRLIGAPECCTDQYQSHTATREDPIWAVAGDTSSTVERDGERVVRDPHPILNPLWAYKGWTFIDFYPCSFECDEARQTAIETGRILRETGHGAEAEAAFEFLSTPTYWSGYHGLAHLKTSWCIGQYTTDDYWHERTVRLGGYHDDLGSIDSTSSPK